MSKFTETLISLADSKTGHQVSSADLRALRQIAHQLVDQLTAVSGYSQLALERRAAKLNVCGELRKIRMSADKAAELVRFTMVHLQHLEIAD